MDNYTPYTDDGLVQVGTVGYSHYDWNQFDVYYAPAEKLFYWASEGGCSCTYPYEDFTSRADMESGSAQQVHAALDSWYGDGITTETSAGEIADFHAKIASF